MFRHRSGNLALQEDTDVVGYQRWANQLASLKQGKTVELDDRWSGQLGLAGGLIPPEKFIPLRDFEVHKGRQALWQMMMFAVRMHQPGRYAVQAQYADGTQYSLTADEPIIYLIDRC